MSISSARKSSRGRPRVDATPVNVRLPPTELQSLDRWIAAQPEPRPSRPEAIRRLVGEKLKSQGYFTATQRGGSAAHLAGRAYAKGAAGSAVDKAQKGTGQSDRTMARRKKKLTTVPNELAPARKPKHRALSIPVAKLNASNDV